MQSTWITIVFEFGWLLGPLVGLAGLIFGIRRDKRARRTADALRERVESLPREILAAITPALPPEPLEVEYGFEPDDFIAYVGYVDVTNDGRPELLVLHPAGVHASILKIFGHRDEYRGFENLGEIFSGVAGGFEVGDFDGDGAVEIASLNANFDRDPGRGYANAILVANLHRWDGAGFEHVGEGAVYDPESGDAPPAVIEALLSRPSWALGPLAPLKEANPKS
jgi:hypothetical protein